MHCILSSTCLITDEPCLYHQSDMTRVCYRRRLGCHQQVALSGKEHRKYSMPSSQKYKPANMHHHQTDLHAHSRLLCEQDTELPFHLALSNNCATHRKGTELAENGSPLMSQAFQALA